jgi:hypothetical protein
MNGAKGVVLGLEVIAECGGNRFGEGQHGKAIEVSFDVTLDADKTAESGRSVCTSHDCLNLPMVVSIDDCEYMVAGHGAHVAREVKHFMEVADCELCRGCFNLGQAVTKVGGGAVETGAG